MIPLYTIIGGKPQAGGSDLRECGSYGKNWNNGSYGKNGNACGRDLSRPQISSAYPAAIYFFTNEILPLVDFMMTL